MKLLATILLLCTFCIGAVAQDKIIKKTGEAVNCKVTKIVTDEIIYFYSDNPELVFRIDKALVDRIEFETGKIINIVENTFLNSEYYAKQSKNALKINFLSPLSTNLEFVYERNIKPGKSWELALGIIGVGNDALDINPKGVYGKFAYKFMRNPDYYIHKMHYSHILKGAYFAPEIALRYVSFENKKYYSPISTTRIEKDSRSTLALMLKLGKQWVFDDSFLLDVYFGLGYGIESSHYDEEPLNYGFLVLPENFPMAITSGIRIGWVFGK